MRAARLLGLLLAVLAAPLAGRAADPAPLPPQEVVGKLYALPDASNPFLNPDCRACVDRFLARPLAALVRRDAAASQGEVGVIDANPLYDAQDYEPKNLTIGVATVEGVDATVAVTFENYGQKKRILYRLERDADAWRISDIVYDRDRTLLTSLREAYPTP